LPDRGKDVDACQTEADRFYQGYRGPNVDNPRNRYVIACMGAKGYEFDVSPADCDSRHVLVSQAACFKPDSWLTQLLIKFR
jgi:hypothetical protein